MPPKKTGKQVYTKAAKVVKGTIITDIKRKEWVIGDLLGEGGFGFIYLIKQQSDSEYKQVVKIEPSSNGPMFTEINFYKRVCMESDIKNWISKQKLKYLGMPRYISTGSQSDVDNRFLIMDRYGRDLHYTLTHENISASTIFQITINVLDVLEYIHSHGYVHADIKALNILKDFKIGNQIYLLDFGMVSQYIDSKGHKPDKIDKKRQHNGTLDFCPRDSHIGRFSSRRSDIESLMYNLIYWLTWDMANPNGTSHVGYGKLPWMSLVIDYNKSNNSSILNKVAEIKEKYMSDSDLFVNSVDLSNASYSNDLKHMIDEINQIPYESAPNYDNLRRQLVNMYCISKEIKCPTTKVIDFNKFRPIEWESSNVVSNTRKRRSSARKCDEENKLSVEKEEQVNKPKAKRSKPAVETPKDKKKIEPTKPESVEAKAKAAATKVPRRKKVLKQTKNEEEVVNFVTTTKSGRNKKVLSEEDLFDSDGVKENLNLNESDSDKSLKVVKRKLNKRPHNTEDNGASKRKPPKREVEGHKLKESATDSNDIKIPGLNKKQQVVEDNSVSKRQSPNEELEIPYLDCNKEATNSGDNCASKEEAPKVIPVPSNNYIKIPGLNCVPYKTKSSKTGDNQNKAQTKPSSDGAVRKPSKPDPLTSEETNEKCVEAKESSAVKDCRTIIPGLSSIIRMKDNINATKK